MGATQGEGWDNPRPPVVGNGSACSNVDVDLDRYEGEEWANPRPTMIINGIAYTDLHDLELENDDVYVDATFQNDYKSEQARSFCSPLSWQGCTSTPPRRAGMTAPQATLILTLFKCGGMTHLKMALKETPPTGKLTTPLLKCSPPPL